MNKKWIIIAFGISRYNRINYIFTEKYENLKSITDNIETLDSVYPAYTYSSS